MSDSRVERTLENVRRQLRDERANSARLQREVERLRTIEVGFEGYELVSISAPLRTNGHGEHVFTDWKPTEWTSPTDGVPMSVILVMLAKPDQ